MPQHVPQSHHAMPSPSINTTNLLHFYKPPSCLVLGFQQTEQIGGSASCSSHIFFILAPHIFFAFTKAFLLSLFLLAPLSFRPDKYNTLTIRTICLFLFLCNKKHLVQTNEFSKLFCLSFTVRVDIRVLLFLVNDLLKIQIFTGLAAAPAVNPKKCVIFLPNYELGLSNPS